ncbi:MAG: hypothetical protein AAF737_06745, partial [Pseudomonadota bacterium]
RMYGQDRDEGNGVTFNGLSNTYNGRSSSAGDAASYAVGDETQAGAGGGEVSINLDITRNLKAKGSVASDGNSKLGIFFEKDY